MRVLRIRKEDHGRLYIGLMRKDRGIWFTDGFGLMLNLPGGVSEVGVFQRRGLRYGVEFYSNGHIRTAAIYNDGERESYYGPSYPVYGILYSEDGELLYEGPFKVEKLGSVGWPRIVRPEEYRDHPRSVKKEKSV